MAATRALRQVIFADRVAGSVKPLMGSLNTMTTADASTSVVPEPLFRMSECFATGKVEPLTTSSQVWPGRTDRVAGTRPSRQTHALAASMTAAETVAKAPTRRARRRRQNRNSGGACGRAPALPATRGCSWCEFMSTLPASLWYPGRVFPE
ncbi:hypothetical protein R75461_08505 [Paraburkholderia nemoris]|nr:hypothetical protein R75461_08505 [Paraburkholderia nemoris]